MRYKNELLTSFNECSRRYCFLGETSVSFRRNGRILEDFQPQYYLKRVQKTPVTLGLQNVIYQDKKIFLVKYSYKLLYMVAKQEVFGHIWFQFIFRLQK